MQHPLCDGQESAEKAVNEVWESCFRDTRPFDEVSVLGRQAREAIQGKNWSVS